MNDQRVDGLESLEREHGEIRTAMKELQAAVAGFKRGETTAENWERFNQFSNLIDSKIRRHFHKEEQALYPIVGEVLGIDTGPIDKSTEEHRLLFEAFDQIQSGIASREQAKVLEGAGKILEVLTPHIRLEEQTMIDVARQSLAPWQLEEVNRKMR